MASVTGFCPQGGTFYVCQGNQTQFLGCCSEDPCSDGTGECPQTSLRYTSYNADDYNAIPPEDCASSGLWYTCSAIDTAFMGCCLENPCQNNGCTQGNLTAARLSDITSDAEPFMTPTSSSSDNKTTLSTGAIVGIAVGAAVGALIGGILLFCCYKRHERRKAGQAALRDEFQQSPAQTTPGIHMPSPYQGEKAVLMVKVIKVQRTSKLICSRLHWLPKSSVPTRIRTCIRREQGRSSLARLRGRSQSIRIMASLKCDIVGIRGPIWTCEGAERASIR